MVKLKECFLADSWTKPGWWLSLHLFSILESKPELGASQVVKNPPAMQKTWVRSLGQEDALEKGNGNPFQYSCLGNPMDRGAWQATVHGVVKESDRTEQLTLPLFFPHWFTEDPSLWWALLWITAPWITSSIAYKRARIKSLHFVGGICLPGWVIFWDYVPDVPAWSVWWYGLVASRPSAYSLALLSKHSFSSRVPQWARITVMACQVRQNDNLRLINSNLHTSPYRFTMKTATGVRTWGPRGGNIPREDFWT